MIDVEKLERLACLHLTDTQKEKVSESIDGVVKMFDNILNQEVNSNNQSTHESYQTRFRPENTGVQFNVTKGLNLVDGEYFVAPKVIKKD